MQYAFAGSEAFMGAEKTSKKKLKKDSQLVIRINGAERDQFVELCDALDTSAAREIRGFIREFVRNNKRPG